MISSKQSRGMLWYAMVAYGMVVRYAMVPYGTEPVLGIFWQQENGLSCLSLVCGSYDGCHCCGNPNSSEQRVPLAQSDNVRKKFFCSRNLCDYTYASKVES